MNKTPQEEWDDFMFNLKFWLVVTCAGLLIYEIIKLF